MTSDFSPDYVKREARLFVQFVASLLIVFGITIIVGSAALIVAERWGIMALGLWCISLGVALLAMSRLHTRWEVRSR